MLNELRKNNKGMTAVIMTLLLLSGILTVTLAAGELVSRGVLMSSTQHQSVKAFFAAEAGAERILYEVRKNGLVFRNPECPDNEYVIFQAGGKVSTSTSPFIDCEGAADVDNDNIRQLSNGAEFYLQATTTPDIIVTSYGSYNDMTRVVKIKY